MKKILASLLLLSSFSFAQTTRLSEQAEISVITIGPFQGELYSAFGHSAFRVYDPVLEIDYAFDYGVFDFDQPNFYLNFARGFLYYKVALRDYKRFEYSNIYFNRYVHEQVLDLTSEQSQKLFDYLMWNIKPENESYRYDYFYDNCASKLPEIMLKLFGDSVRFDGSYITTQYTIRELTDLYLTHQPWGDLGIDICLGLPMDKKASPYEYMFLPDFVESGFDHAFVNKDGEVVPIVKEKRIIYEARDEELPKGLPHPLIVLSVITVLALALSARDIKKGKLSTWFDATLFGITGSIGLLLFLLWFATDHAAAAYNFNLLWALPTHLVAVVAFIKQPRWLEKYFLIVLIMTALLLITWFVLPQKLNYSLLPVVLALGARAYVQYYIRKKKNRMMNQAGT